MELPQIPTEFAERATLQALHTHCIIPRVSVLILLRVTNKRKERCCVSNVVLFFCFVIFMNRTVQTRACEGYAITRTNAVYGISPHYRARFSSWFCYGSPNVTNPNCFANRSWFGFVFYYNCSNWYLWTTAETAEASPKTAKASKPTTAQKNKAPEQANKTTVKKTKKKK